MEATRETVQTSKLDECERVEMTKGMKQNHSAGENTTCVVCVHSLPEEVMEKILLDVIVQELLEDKLTKFQQKGCVSLRINERVNGLKSVCRKWKSVFSCSTELLQNKVLLQLSCTGVKPIRILVKSHGGKYSLMAKLHKKLYVFVRVSRLDFSFSLEVYCHDGDDLELEVSKKLNLIKNMAACVACHDCVYALAEGGIWKVNTKDLSESLWLDLSEADDSYAMISVSKDGNLLATFSEVVKIYGANAEVLYSIELSIDGYLDICSRGINVVEKRNGNFVVCYMSMTREPKPMKHYMTEFARDGTVVWDLDNLPDHLKGEIWLDSDERIIAIDCCGRGYCIIDSDGKGYDMMPLEGLFVSLFASYVSDAHYDPEENILYIGMI